MGKVFMEKLRNLLWTKFAVSTTQAVLPVSVVLSRVAAAAAIYLTGKFHGAFTRKDHQNVGILPVILSFIVGK